MAKRGEFTPFMAVKMKDFLGRESNRTELRLLPYIVDIMMNAQKIDPAKIRVEEREIISLWKQAGYVSGGMNGFAVTQEFWEFAIDIVFHAYVAYREQDENASLFKVRGLIKAIDDHSGYSVGFLHERLVWADFPINDVPEELAHQIVELTGTIEEFIKKPCLSLSHRMQGAARDAKKVIGDA